MLSLPQLGSPPPPPPGEAQTLLPHTEAQLQEQAPWLHSLLPPLSEQPQMDAVTHFSLVIRI